MKNRTPFPSPYIIAEVGQNHQGDLQLAKKFIEVFSSLGASAVKFQIRDNKRLFDKSRYNLVYDSPNSFGVTYGEHREFLEFSKSELYELKTYAEEHSVDFCCTPFDLPSLDKLIELDVKYLKVASFDLGNLPFLSRIGQSKRNVIISTGGGDLEIISRSLTYLDCGQPIALLHCTSEYPCPAEKVDLEMLRTLLEEYPQYTIGLSDHYNGTLTGPLGFLFGARVFEKHVTFDRSQKGSDHKFSLEPDGFKRFVRDIYRAEQMCNTANRSHRGNEPVFQRLGKSCVAAKSLPEGHSICLDDIDGIVFDKQYIPIRNSSALIGMTLRQYIEAGQPFIRGTHLDY